MDEDRIGLVLARAAELKSKITHSIHMASSLQPDDTAAEEKHVKEVEKKDTFPGDGEADTEGEEEEDEDAQSLLNIRDALESLEAQLSSLQALQQQQWYEKEVALADIDYSRKKLLKKLKEYKGEDLEVIHEAATFASETVQENSDLLLPPYPSRPSRSLVSDNRYFTNFPSTSKFVQNGLISDPKHELKLSLNASERERMHSDSKGPFKVMKTFIGATMKTALTVVGVLTILSQAGFEPHLKKRDSPFKVLSLFKQQEMEDKRSEFPCPLGKVPLVENGETRCVVKERVEIPFESVVAKPDVNFGCG